MSGARRLEGVEEHEVFVQAQESRVQPVERPPHLVQPLFLGVVGQPGRGVVDEELLRYDTRERGTANGGQTAPNPRGGKHGKISRMTRGTHTHRVAFPLRQLFGRGLEAHASHWRS